MKPFFMKTHFFSKIVFFTFIIVTVFSCRSTENKIPYVYVNLTLDLNKPEFSDLNAIGNYVYITGGVSGIVVYRDGLTDFYAYERACPYDPECGRVYVDYDHAKLIDTCCGSEFSLTLEGALLSGPAELPLRRYATYYNTNTNQLTISNQY